MVILRGRIRLMMLSGTLMLARAPALPAGEAPAGPEFAVGADLSFLRIGNDA